MGEKHLVHKARHANPAIIDFIPQSCDFPAVCVLPGDAAKQTSVGGGGVKDGTWGVINYYKYPALLTRKVRPQGLKIRLSVETLFHISAYLHTTVSVR